MNRSSTFALRGGLVFSGFVGRRVALNDSFPFCSRHYAEIIECLRLAELCHSRKTEFDPEQPP
jgi:hypothetical protein